MIRRGMDRREVRLLMQRLERDARHIAGRFELRYRALEPERRGVTSRYGLCTSDGLIKIRLRHASTGRPLKYSSLVNTLCHELAHLRHFDHGPRFRAFYLRLLEFARAEGIYRPRAPARPEAREARPRRLPGPEQLDLFV
jgi:predicted metal-dependent hydrolase